MYTVCVSSELEMKLLNPSLKGPLKNPSLKGLGKGRVSKIKLREGKGLKNITKGREGKGFELEFQFCWM